MRRSRKPSQCQICLLCSVRWTALWRATFGLFAGKTCLDRTTFAERDIPLETARDRLIRNRTGAQLARKPCGWRADHKPTSTASEGASTGTNAAERPRSPQAKTRLIRSPGRRQGRSLGDALPGSPFLSRPSPDNCDARQLSALATPQVARWGRRLGVAVGACAELPCFGRFVSNQPQTGGAVGAQKAGQAHRRG